MNDEKIFFFFEKKKHPKRIWKCPNQKKHLNLLRIKAMNKKKKQKITSGTMMKKQNIKQKKHMCL